MLESSFQVAATGQFMVGSKSMPPSLIILFIQLTRMVASTLSSTPAGLGSFFLVIGLHRAPDKFYHSISSCITIITIEEQKSRNKTSQLTPLRAEYVRLSISCNSFAVRLNWLKDAVWVRLYISFFHTTRHVLHRTSLAFPRDYLSLFFVPIALCNESLVATTKYP